MNNRKKYQVLDGTTLKSATGFSFIPLALYNGKKGKGLKWLFYCHLSGTPSPAGCDKIHVDIIKKSLI